MVLIFLFLVALLSPDTSDVHIQTEQQVDYYAQNLAKNENKSLNSWAIQQIASLNCETLDIVKKRLQNLPKYHDYYSQFNCENIEELKKNDLNIQFWKENLSAKYKNIHDGKINISVNELAYDSNPLIHFVLIMDGEASTYYSAEYLQNALNKWLEIKGEFQEKNSLQYALLISNIIRAAYMLDAYEILGNQYQSFLALTYLPNSIHKLRLLGAFDYTFYIYGYYDRSLKLQREQTLPLAKFFGDKTTINTIKNRQGAYLFSLGKYQESKNIYEELYKDSLDVESQYSLFTNLGINYLILGQSNKYISFQLRALNQKNISYKSLLNIYRNLFVYYTSVKDINSALEYIDRAKELAKANSDTAELSLIDLYLASFYWTTYRDQTKALKYLESAKTVLSVNKDYARYLKLLIEEASIYSKIDSLDKAQKLFLKVKELSLSKSNTPNYVDALVNLTDIYLKKGNLPKAEENLEEIKLYPLDNLTFPLLTKFYTVKAEYLRATRNARAAIRELKPLITQITDRSKNNTDSQEGYWSVEDEYLDAFSLIVDLLIESGEPDEALVFLDQLKTINDASLYNSPLVKASKLSEEDLADEKRLNNQLQTLRKQYLNASDEERFIIKRKMDRTSAAREQILSKVNLTKEENLPPVWSIRRSIKPNEAVLHFTQIGTKLYLSFLTSESTNIEVFDFTVDRQERFNSIADELASGRTDLNHLYELYQLLNLHEIPANIDQLTVIPDNYLYRIPLEVLPTQKPDSPISFGSTHYLLEEYQFRYFTSLQEFDHNRRTFSSNTTNDFTGFAISNFKNFESTNLPSLPYATIETENINSVLTSFDQKKIYTGSKATKDNFKKQVGNSRLVHVATHSEVSEQDPLFSTIYLKNSDAVDSLESDQALYAYELFDTPLNSEFIMLNSCSSGSGNYIQGSGVMGISRALRYAGAKSLALNLWSVNDKVASKFATDFYGYLNKGITKSEAMRLAKIDQLQKANANPHFWGAYMMIGNPSPITNKPANSVLLFALLTGTTLLFGYSTYKKRSI